MLSFEFISKDREKLDALMTEYCEALRGYPPFRNDEVFISDIQKSVNDTWAFRLLVGTEEDTEQVTETEIHLDSSDTRVFTNPL